MRRVLLAVLAATWIACAGAVNYTNPDGPRYVGGEATVPPPRPELRIVTFNVARAVHIPGAIECLGRPPLRDADVVLLQEMDAPGTQSIADALALRYVYYPGSVRPGERDMGNAILSPWPIEDTRKLLLPHTSFVVHRQRTATVATVTIGGRPVRVYSVHLTSPLGGGGGTRRDQADAVVADVRDWNGPVIAGGDLNSRSVGNRFEAAGFRWLTKSVRKTVNLFTFDHVFVRGFDSMTVTDAVVDRSCQGVSDHSPVLGTLRESGAP
jgi:endonuclease/exonuclease/phosphatase family metal-dependent hydrolase